MTNSKMHAKMWFLLCVAVSCFLLVHSKALPREERAEKPDIYDIILEKIISIALMKVRNYILSFIPFIG